MQPGFLRFIKINQARIFSETASGLIIHLEAEQLSLPVNIHDFYN
ncbi:hypothetical protein BN133_4125 [Cronobacter dublinensis 582]|nr:hypothetical protein BN133_4125 [Cronobacter dublinensis 582]